MDVKKCLSFIAFSLYMHVVCAQLVYQVPVLIIGGGTGGTAAGIQSGRMGVKTMIVESGPWLGGMISSAGVSATDGNHKLASGLWKEFRDQLYTVYGGAHGVETGWVSNTLFEPHVADSIFKKMAANTNHLSVLYGWQFTKVFKKANRITGAQFINPSGKTMTVEAAVTIDATEMGDVIAAAALPYDLGMEAAAITGETVGITESNHIIQDLTYVAILKDYGDAADCTIVRPVGYDSTEFDGACTDFYVNKNLPAPKVDAKKMLAYGKLPNKKYMLNWPLAGNDTYLNIVELTEAQRQAALLKAKETTKRFIYFIQQQLGFKNLGLANDEFPSADKLALIPYYREGRRVKGLVRYTMRHLAEPFTYGDPLYRTGISVGDYPIDHHHKKNTLAPQHLEFYPVPSYNVPLGSLIPMGSEGLIIAEKGISVSNVVNGTTRLQPCVLLTGQAAGTLAALAVLQKKNITAVPVRSVQLALLNSGAYIMPYIDVPFDHKQFIAIQKIGATGIMKGRGIPYKWANQTWFYPDSLMTLKELVEGLQPYYKKVTANKVASLEITGESLLALLQTIQPGIPGQQYKQTLTGLGIDSPGEPIKRAAIAFLLQKYLRPFDKAIDIRGNIQKVYTYLK
ncbi:MAG: FAD-dependent oxidoreductase [Ferruginibacter sp.]|nr:FAD-dependent oxidoreductase [Ferruginibacter sp.]